MVVNVKSFSCWQCKYFRPLNVDLNVQGYCRRHAPYALDYWGFANAGGTSPLTTKGDIYTHDGAADSRLPVGTDGQMLVADSAELTGQKYVNPPTPGSDPTTTKGDLFSNDGTGPDRLPAGTDGQMLVADSAELLGLKYIDAPSTAQNFLLHFQSARFQDIQAQEVLMSRDGEQPGSGQTKAISNGVTTFNNGGSFPFTAPDYATMYAVQIAGSRFQTGAPTVGLAPTVKIDFYSIIGTGESIIGTIFVPLDPAKTQDQNTSIDNYQSVVYTLPVPLAIPAFGLWGWRMDLTVSGDENLIWRQKNVVVTPYVGIAPPAATMAAFKLAGLNPEEAMSYLADPTSAGKYALITDGDNMWCGEFERNNKPIPPIPGGE